MVGFVRDTIISALYDAKRVLPFKLKIVFSLLIYIPCKIIGANKRGMVSATHFVSCLLFTENSPN